MKKKICLALLFVMTMGMTKSSDDTEDRLAHGKLIARMTAMFAQIYLLDEMDLSRVVYEICSKYEEQEGLLEIAIVNSQNIVRIHSNLDKRNKQYPPLLMVQKDIWDLDKYDSLVYTFSKDHQNYAVIIQPVTVSLGNEKKIHATVRLVMRTNRKNGIVDKNQNSPETGNALLAAQLVSLFTEDEWSNDFYCMELLGKVRCWISEFADVFEIAITDHSNVIRAHTSRSKLNQGYSIPEQVVGFDDKKEHVQFYHDVERVTFIHVPVFQKSPDGKRFRGNVYLKAIAHSPS